MTSMALSWAADEAAASHIYRGRSATEEFISAMRELVIILLEHEIRSPPDGTALSAPALPL
jgi:hypothetical protein